MKELIEQLNVASIYRHEDDAWVCDALVTDECEIRVITACSNEYADRSEHLIGTTWGKKDELV